MEIIPADGHCIVADGIIVWSDAVFNGWFSHRDIGPGARLGQLFPAAEEHRPGAVYEDLDRLGKKRFFAMELLPNRGRNGEKVSDNVRVRKVTLQRVLAEIPKLATQVNTPGELFDKVLWLLRDTTHYLAFAGFIARGDRLELVASKGWTEKLKSYVSVQPITPDSPSLTGRSAYHRQQIVMAMSDYSLSPNVKSAVHKLGGEYVVVTPLLDREKLVGVLTVINDKELTPADFEALQSICGQTAAALDMKLQEEAAVAKADEAVLLASLIARNSADRMLDIAGLISALNDNAPRGNILLKDAVDDAVSGARELAKAAHTKLNVRAIVPADLEASPLIKFAVYEALKNCVQHTASPSVDVTVRASRERSGMQRIEISDNGPGIPDEFKSEAFRPVKANMKNPGGMGLYLIKNIARIGGGRVWVEDRVHGDYRKGASLVITIPARRYSALKSE